MPLVVATILRFAVAALEGQGDTNESAIVAADLEGVRTERQGVRVNPILPGAVDASLYREMNAGRNRWRS